MDRVWLVSEFYYPVVVTTGYYVTEIADYLSKKGMNVGVISTITPTMILMLFQIKQESSIMVLKFIEC